MRSGSTDPFKIGEYFDESPPFSRIMISRFARFISRQFNPEMFKHVVKHVLSLGRFLEGGDVSKTLRLRGILANVDS